MNRLFLFLSLFLLSSLHSFVAAQSMETEQDIFETMHSGDKAVIVAVHVGAEDATEWQRIDRFNTRLRQAYPQCDFREAWTSRTCIKAMGSNGVSAIPTPDELFIQLKKNGYTHVLVQSSSIVNCTEMQFLRYAVENARKQFKQMRLGEPLLSEAADYEGALKATAAAFGNTKTANVLMCNTAAGTADAQYAMLDYMLHDKDFKGWFVGIIDGYPSLDSLIKQLKSQKVKKVHLIPFMFTATPQVTAEAIKNWTQRLQKAGCHVTAETRCLGDVDGIMDIFESHIRHAEKYRTYSAKELKLMK